MRNSRGFTIVEVLIALTVGMIVLAAVYSTVLMGQRSTSAIERKVAAQQDVRPALELMALEIGMASCNAHLTSLTWLAPSDCTSSGVQSYKGIQEATESSIAIEMNLDAASTSIGDSANEIIKYAYSPADNYIWRSTNCGGTQPFLGDRPNADPPRTIRVVNDDAVPVFRYFNGSGAEITTADLPAGIPNIRRIDITLVVESEDIDPGSGVRKRLIYSTTAIPRNHGINF